MKLYHLSSGPLRVNTYFLVGENGKTAVIDSGENYKLIKETAAKNGFDIIAVLLTHAHFDHAGNVKRLQDDGAKIYVSVKDSDKLCNKDNLAVAFGRKFEACKPDFTFSDGDVIRLAGMEIKVMETPGHTDGSVTFIVDKTLFTGDTLFRESVGRTDFPTGDRDALVASVKKLFALDGDYAVYPGHEEFTTLEYERKHNLFADYD